MEKIMKMRKVFINGAIFVIASLIQTIAMAVPVTIRKGEWVSPFIIVTGSNPANNDVSKFPSHMRVLTETETKTPTKITTDNLRWIFNNKAGYKLEKRPNGNLDLTYESMEASVWGVKDTLTPEDTKNGVIIEIDKNGWASLKAKPLLEPVTKPAPVAKPTPAPTAAPVTSAYPLGAR